jgi:hypothetical protein
MANYRGTPARRSPGTSRSGVMAWIAVIATLINALVRLFGLFKKSGAGSGRTTTSRSDDAANVPAPTQRTSTQTRGRDEAVPAPVRAKPVSAKAGPRVDDGGIGDLYRQQRGDVVVTASGTVVKMLPDDTDTSDGSEQHQKFLVELPAAPGADAITIRICHNLKFGRLPIAEGDAIRFKGEYEYTELGGTVHWTHRDPRGTHEDGYIELNGTRYE